MMADNAADAENHTFRAKKARILDALRQPSDSYQDASPKGSVDEGIRDLIELINSFEDLVTTSSCSGRIAVFLNAAPTPRLHRQPLADAAILRQPGPSKESLDVATASIQDSQHAQSRIRNEFSSSGKGAGGRWLFVTHEKMDIPDNANATLAKMLGLSNQHPGSGAVDVHSYQLPLVHLKFEPMILHIQTASIKAAQTVLTAALQAGFRESGVTGLSSACPMIAVRCQGLAFESVIGVRDADASREDPHAAMAVPIVSNAYLSTVIRTANDRFDQNAQRTERFTDAVRRLQASCSSDVSKEAAEAPEARRARKRAEGLKRQASPRTTDSGSN